MIVSMKDDFKLKNYSVIGLLSKKLNLRWFFCLLIQ